ncbi:MAG: multiprotein-bridging factor 1 family protein [Candidatus Nanopusillus sp.]|nr:multiprotein-bridging factor 1 family protein [Candidatus Nanopusillus sp.]
MKTCELCGKSTDKLYKVYIEGTILSVCKDCLKYGKLVDENENIIKENKLKIKEIVGEVIDENYNKILIKYREEHKLRQEDMAKLLGIKESLYKSIENKKIIPDINLAKKIEKTLGIKITKKEVLTEKINNKDNKNYITVGDILEFEE